MTHDELIKQLKRTDDATVSNTLRDVQRVGAGVAFLDWSPLLVVAATFLVALA